jgi:hypothetical protein
MGRQCEQQSERQLSKKPKSSNAKEDGTEQEDGTKMSVSVLRREGQKTLLRK